MYFRQLTAPSGEVVNLEKVKKHIQVEHAEDDYLISSYIDSAVAACASYTGRHIQDVQYEQAEDDPKGEIKLRGRPLKSVESVIVGGIPWTEDMYTIIPDDRSPAITPVADNWNVFGPNTLVIRFTTGYSDPALIPKELIQAILMTVGHWYENREAVVVGVTANELPMAAKALMDLRRVRPV